MSAPRLLLPFADDSTLFFAARMRAVLAGSGAEVVTAWLVNGSDLSHRQLTGVFPEGPDMILRNPALAGFRELQDFDAILTSRMFPPLRDALAKLHFRYAAQRPGVIAFQGGLEFDPTRGYRNRRYADGVFVVPRAAIEDYRAVAEAQGAGDQYVGFGHPTFLTPPKGAGPAPGGDIYFFTQAISPRTRAGREHMLAVMAAIARAHPDRTVWLKLRHLPSENTEHLHKEMFAYPALAEALPGGWPENLRMTADPMETVLARAAVGITCTSTAAIDLIRAGVPTLVHLDYVENYRDDLMPPMAEIFADSGLIAPLEQVLELETVPPDPAWLARYFTAPQALAAEVLAAVDHYRNRPYSVRMQRPDPFADPL